MKERASVKTIAAALNISAAAVSKALNDKPDVGSELKARVRAEAEAQGFVLNRAARQLSSGTSRTIGVYLMNRFGRPVREYFGFHLLDGLLARAQENDMDILLLQDHDHSGAVIDWVRQARERAVAGLVVYGIDPAHPQTGDFAACGLPCVAVDSPIPGLPLVSSDQRTGIRHLVQSLLSLGHRRIAYIGLRGNGWVAQERLAGVREAQAGAELIELEAVLSLDGGAEAAARALSLHPRSDALVCATDIQAWGAMAEAKRLGLDVPADLSITGFDDLQPSAYLSPGLSTVAQDGAGLGSAALTVLLDLIQGRTPPQCTLIPVKTIIRGSTGPRSYRLVKENP